MNLFLRKIYFFKYFPILFLFILVIPSSVLINSEILQRFAGIHISNKYNDLNHYLSLAENLRCSAFYPLWPLLIKSFSHLKFINLHLSAVTLSITFGLISLFIGINTITKLSVNQKSSTILSYIYVLSPMTVFFFVGYTEAFFSLLSWIAISMIIKFYNNDSFEFSHFLSLFLIYTLLSLTRATMVQTIFSSFGSLILIKLNNSSPNDNQLNFKKLIKFSVCMITGCLFGYLLIGIFCSVSGEGFLAPFAYQKEWGKSLGFRPLFLLNTRSPVIDLWGLYYPFLIFASYLVDFSVLRIKFEKLSLLIYQNFPITLIYPPLGLLISILKKSDRKLIRSKKFLINLSQADDLYFQENEFLFLYCILFSISHSLICFFTQEQFLYSLGRYVFGQPYFYVAFAILINSKRRMLVNNPKIILTFSLIISILYLIKNFVDFGDSKLLL